MAKSKKGVDDGTTTVATNRKARHDYFVLDQLEVGIALQGAEVKSFRNRSVSINEAFGRIDNGELWLHGMYVAPYEAAGASCPPPRRPRKLLAHRSEIRRLEQRTRERGHLPQLEGKLNGMAVRVPTPNVSVVDLVVLLSKPASVEEINSAMKEAAEGYLNGILAYCDQPLVSIDFNGTTVSSTVDAMSTMAVGGDMVKILSWYDNEYGYANRMIDLVLYMAGS